MIKFFWECSKASLEIMKAMGLGLNLEDPEFFLKFHSGHNNQLRLLHYPPIPSAELHSGTSARMPAHSDWGTFTMLFQDECGGLEAEKPDSPGEFIQITPYENAIVMNVGDLLMRWSNGEFPKFPKMDVFLMLIADYLKSTLHRVILPPGDDRFTSIERMTRSRYSIPYFVAPDSETLIECLIECTSDENPAKHGPVTQREYNLMRGKLQY